MAEWEFVCKSMKPGCEGCSQTTQMMRSCHEVESGVRHGRSLTINSNHLVMFIKIESLITGSRHIFILSALIVGRMTHCPLFECDDEMAGGWTTLSRQQNPLSRVRVLDASHTAL